MIKRRFYRVDHSGCNSASDGSASSDEDSSFSSSFSDEPESGYESEDSSDSGQEGDGDEKEESHSDPEDKESSKTFQDCRKSKETSASNSSKRKFEALPSKCPYELKETAHKTAKLQADILIDDCVVQHKSVLKCKLCPRIVCLSVNSMKEHLNSKRHARSKRLHAEGRLKLMLNSDGEVEDEMETHAERHARILAVALEPAEQPKKRNDEKQMPKTKKHKKRKGKS